MSQETTIAFDPIARRFRTYEDALAFMNEPDDSLSIWPRVEADGKNIPNPEWVEAPYEIAYRFIK